MANFTCSDINGLAVSEFVFDNNGTVLGELADTSLSPVSEECCNALNFIWESSTNSCYWSETCAQGPDFKIVLGGKGNDGSWFQVDENETCHLEVNFKYLLQFDCDDITNCLIDNNTPLRNGALDYLSIFESLDIAVTVDKLVDQNPPTTLIGQTTFINNTALSTVHEEDLYNVDNIVDYFDGNCNTGILVTGNTTCKNQIQQSMVLNLSGDCGVLSACTLDSDWIDHSFIVSDEVSLSAITNEWIKLGFLIRNCDCDFSVLIDRIEINKVCTALDKEEIYITKCPSFDLERVCDNKKSWVAKDTPQDRDLALPMRETDYDIDHHKLAINTKEVDLDISPANAVEIDVWNYIKVNEDILDCSTGTTTATTITCNTPLTGSTGDLGVNIQELLTTEVSSITTIKEFDNVLYTELIDVKNRKTISSYPTLKALYNRYKLGFQSTPQSSQFDYFKMDNFVKLIGDYWVDLIEQVIPSTTIWGSTYKYRNTIFDNNKFNYKKYSLVTCTVTNGISYPSPTSGYNSTVEVITITNDEIFEGPDCLTPTGETVTCSGVTIQQINHGSEFIGSVSVIGAGGEIIIT